MKLGSKEWRDKAYKLLRDQDSWSLESMAEALGTTNGPNFRRELWEVQQELRAHCGREFRPLGRGEFDLCDGLQTFARAKRTAARGRRAHRRSISRGVAAVLTVDESGRQAIQRWVDREEQHGPDGLRRSLLEERQARKEAEAFAARMKDKLAERELLRAVRRDEKDPQ